MKTKAKLTLAASVLSAVVLATAVTSTFAWFTTRATASVTSTLQIKGPSGLAVSVQRVMPTNGTTALETQEQGATPTQSVETAANIPLGAVSSSEGRYFVAPKALGQSYTVGTTDFDLVTGTWAHSATNPYVGFLKYNVVVSADQDGASQDLALTVAIDDKTDEKFGRVSIYEIEQAKGQKHVDDPDGEGPEEATDYPELPAATADIEPMDGGYAGVFKQGVSADTTETRLQYATGPSITEKANAKINALPNKAKIANNFTSTTGKAYKYYVVAVWMEGCANDDQNGLAGKTISTTITFDLVKHTNN